MAFRRFVGLVPRSRPADPRRRQPGGARAWRRWRGAPVETFGVDGGRRLARVGDRGRDGRRDDVRPHGAAASRSATSTSPLYRRAQRAERAGGARGRSRRRALGRGDDARRSQDFRGVRRRLELRGAERGVSVFDDFAHHPTAILETLRAVRWSYPDRRIWAIFEPRSATSCRRVFQDDFARAFAESGADEVILAAVFRVVTARGRAAVGRGARPRPAARRAGAPGTSRT